MAKTMMIWLAFALTAAFLPNAARADVLQVVASLPALGRVAQAVGGDEVSVTTIASGVQDPHFVDPRPSYMVKLRDADFTRHETALKNAPRPANGLFIVPKVIE